MRITIDIPNEEIREAVKEQVVKRLSDHVIKELFNTSGGYARNTYLDEIRNATRQILHDNEGDITKRAVESASAQLAKRGLNAVVKQLLTENK